MSYHVELAQEEHQQVLKDTLGYWNKQEHDVQLLSTEGYRISSHKNILSVYSSQLRSILNEPEIVYSSQIPTLSLPASSTCISSVGWDSSQLKDNTTLQNLIISVKNLGV